jgi:hypothetical protein
LGVGVVVVVVVLGLEIVGIHGGGAIGGGEGWAQKRGSSGETQARR